MPEPNSRSEGRSNVFLTASLETEGGTFPVRIRNIASRGVLIEAHSLPAVGARARLVRGPLSAEGVVTWNGAGQAGINFDKPIEVRAWVKRVGHVGQQRVDQAVQAIRERRELPVDWTAPARLKTIAEISAALDAVCERLSHAPGMSLELGEDLVELDTIAQALRRTVLGKPS